MQWKYLLRLWAFINPLLKSGKVCRLQWITTFLFQSLCLYRIESGVLAFLARHATRVVPNSHITREIMVILPHLSHHHTLTLCFTFQFFSRVNYLWNLMEVIWFWPQYIFRNTSRMWLFTFHGIRLFFNIVKNQDSVWMR